MKTMVEVPKVGQVVPVTATFSVEGEFTFKLRISAEVDLQRMAAPLRYTQVVRLVPLPVNDPEWQIGKCSELELTLDQFAEFLVDVAPEMGTMIEALLVRMARSILMKDRRQQRIDEFKESLRVHRFTPIETFRDPDPGPSLPTLDSVKALLRQVGIKEDAIRVNGVVSVVWVPLSSMTDEQRVDIKKAVNTADSVISGLPVMTIEYA